MSDLHESFDRLTREIEQAKIACAKSHAAWSADASKLNRLEREQKVIWDMLLDGITAVPR